MATDRNNHNSTLWVVIAALNEEEGIGPALETNPFYVGNNICLWKACNNGVKSCNPLSGFRVVKWLTWGLDGEG